MDKSESCGFFWVEEGRLAGSAYPSQCLRWLKEEKGIKAILSLEPLKEQDIAKAEQLGFIIKTINIQDYTAGKLEQRKEAIELIDYLLKLNHPTLVHCYGGLGRTGMILAIYLVTRKGFSPQSAIETIRALQPGAIEEKTGQKEAIFNSE